MRSLLPLKIHLVGNWLGQQNVMEVIWREASCTLTWFGWPSFTPVVIKKRLAPLASIPSIWAQNELPGPDPNLICTLKLNSPNCNLKQSCPGQFTEQWVKKTKCILLLSHWGLLLGIHYSDKSCMIDLPIPQPCFPQTVKSTGSPGQIAIFWEK